MARGGGGGGNGERRRLVESRSTFLLDSPICTNAGWLNQKKVCVTGKVPRLSNSVRTHLPHSPLPSTLHTEGMSLRQLPANIMLHIALSVNQPLVSTFTPPESRVLSRHQKHDSEPL